MSTDITTRLNNLNAGGVNVFSTIPADSFDDKVKVLSYVSNSQSLEDAKKLDTDLLLTNFIVQSVEMVNDSTGEMSAAPRVILIVQEGDELMAYHAISSPMFASLETITGIIGMPNQWEAPVKVRVSREKGNKGYHYFNLSVV